MKSLPRPLRHLIHAISASTVAEASPELQAPADADCVYMPLHPGPSFKKKKKKKKKN